MEPRNAQVGDHLINLLSDASVWPVEQEEWVASPVDPAGWTPTPVSPWRPAFCPWLCQGHLTAKVREGLPAPPVQPALHSLSKKNLLFGSEAACLLWAAEWYWTSCLASLGLSFPIFKLKF